MLKIFFFSKYSDGPIASSILSVEIISKPYIRLHGSCKYRMSSNSYILIIHIVCWIGIDQMTSLTSCYFYSNFRSPSKRGLICSLRYYSEILLKILIFINLPGTDCHRMERLFLLNFSTYGHVLTASRKKNMADPWCCVYWHHKLNCKKKVWHDEDESQKVSTVQIENDRKFKWQWQCTIRTDSCLPFCLCHLCSDPKRLFVFYGHLLTFLVTGSYMLAFL